MSLVSLQHSPSMLVYLSGTIAICLFKTLRKVHKYWVENNISLYSLSIVDLI